MCLFARERVEDREEETERKRQREGGRERQRETEINWSSGEFGLIRQFCDAHSVLGRCNTCSMEAMRRLDLAVYFLCLIGYPFSLAPLCKLFSAQGCV